MIARHSHTSSICRVLVRVAMTSALAAAGSLLLAAAADARITRVQIFFVQSPTFAGFAWPGVGQYEKLVGVAFGEVDPDDPKNAAITDIQLAKDADGKVRYSF